MEESGIKDISFEDEETLETTNRGVALGLIIFSIYSLAAGALALEQANSGLLVNVNNDLINLLIGKHNTSIYLYIMAQV